MKVKDLAKIWNGRARAGFKWLRIEARAGLL
jgi:hypothetical protein